MKRPSFSAGEPEEHRILVTAAGGSATYVRTGPQEAVLHLQNEFPQGSASLEAGITLAVEDLCRREIDAHRRAIEGLIREYEALCDPRLPGVHIVSDEADIIVRRRYRHNRRLLVVDGERMTYTLRTRLEDAGVDDAKVAIALLSNALQLRIVRIEALYRRILEDLLGEMGVN